MFGHEVTGASKRGALNPSRAETQRVQANTQHGADLSDTGKVHGAAVGIHQSLQQRNRVGGVAVDSARDGALDGFERIGRWRGDRHAKRRVQRSMQQRGGDQRGEKHPENVGLGDRSRTYSILQIRGGPRTLAMCSHGP